MVTKLILLEFSRFTFGSLTPGLEKGRNELQQSLDFNSLCTPTTIPTARTLPKYLPHDEYLPKKHRMDRMGSGMVQDFNLLLYFLCCE